MNSLFQHRLQRYISTQPINNYPLSCSTTRANASAVSLNSVQDSKAQALLLVNTNRTLEAANNTAAQLLNLSSHLVKGQSIDSLAGGILVSVPLRPTAIRATSEFWSNDGRVLLATSRLLTSNEQRFRGWMVSLQQNTSPAGPANPQEAVSSLQKHLSAMRELLSMLPQFSQHYYWRHLLIDHMGKLMDEMEAQLQAIGEVPG
jgi:sensor histidine kinase regulating citrate/malate metabolism